MKIALTLRKAVRQILSTLPKGRRASVDWLVTAINTSTPLVTDEALVKEALAWNHDRGLVESTKNHEFERFEWELTADGRNMEGLAE